jgi:hypothetical protein
MVLGGTRVMPRLERLHDASAEDTLALVGENRLLAVLLCEALHTLAIRSRGEALRRARAWMCARESDQFSFEQACSVFELEPNRVRRRVGLRAHVSRRRTARGFHRGPTV